MMPLNEKTLKSSLDSGALCSVYVVYGNDGFLKKQAVNRLIAASVGEDDGLNLLRFETDCSLQDVYDELNGFPVMADKKCVILTDFDFELAGKNDLERLLALAEDTYETSVFVIYFDAISPDKKSNKFKQLLSTVERSGGAVVLLDHRTRDELARQLSASAKRQGSLLSVRNASYLIDNCSSDTQTLINELSKLCAYANGEEITKEMIDTVAVKSVEASIYDLSSKIIRGDTAGAMELLDKLYFMKVAPEIILFNISSAFVDMYRVAAAKDAGLYPLQILEDFKIPPTRDFVMTRAAENLRRYDYQKLELSFEALLAADGKIKSYSSNDRYIIEQLVVKLIYIMKTGEAL